MYCRKLLAPTLAAGVLTIAGCAVAFEAPEPILQTGHEEAGGFAPFQSGDTMEVLSGIQAGLWLMPTLRHRGFAGEPELVCTVLDLDKDMFLAERAEYVNARKRNGWTNVQYNMHVTLPDEEMNDDDELVLYDGDRVLFECTALDEAGQALVVSNEMLLTM